MSLARTSMRSCFAGALALALCASPAFAQTPPAFAMMSDGTQHEVSPTACVPGFCGGGGGGGLGTTGTPNIVGGSAGTPLDQGVGAAGANTMRAYIASGSLTITNTTFGATQSGTWNVGLTGTLPAFAATPTFNVGSGQLDYSSAAGTPNISHTETVQGCTTCAPQPVISVAGGFVMQLVPTTGTVSTPVAIGSVPAGASGIRIFPQTAAGAPVSVPWTKAVSASAAASQFASGAYQTVAGGSSGTGPNWDENISLSAGTNIYVGPVSGAAVFEFN